MRTSKASTPQRALLPSPASALALAVALVLTSGCRPPTPLETITGHAQTPAPVLGAVALPDTFSATAAEDVLRDGGNAIDAAVAAAFTLAATYPEAGNLGGGGFLLAWVDDQASFLDFREVGPAAATQDMYLDAAGDVIPGATLVGPLAAGVPGTVAGLWTAHQRWGSLPWSRLLEPAIRHAREGYLPPPLLLERIRKKSPSYEDRTNFSRFFGDLQSERLFQQPDLASTLERIAAQGRDGFYLGPTARLISEEMQRGGGLITGDDLASYEPTWREPLSVDWRGQRLLSAPPPSSGGFAVLQLLTMKDVLGDLFSGVPHNSAQYVHLVAEMEKRVFADRAEYLGDPDFVEVPIDQLIDPAYMRRRALEVDPVAISPLEAVTPGLESPNTTHLSIVDAEGQAVALTYTLNTSFGSGVVVEGAGFLLNNEMDDFSAKPGVPNFYGVVGKSANAVGPRKRPLSSMSPTILLDGDEVEMVLGTPGGSTIFTSVFQVLVNVLDYGMSPVEAVTVTRFHHQLLPPDLVTYSPGRPLPADAVEELEHRGYRIEEHGWDFGDVQVIWNDGQSLVPASDPRGRGIAKVIRADE